MLELTSFWLYTKSIKNDSMSMFRSGVEVFDLGQSLESVTANLNAKTVTILLRQEPFTDLKLYFSISKLVKPKQRFF